MLENWLWVRKLLMGEVFLCQVKFLNKGYFVCFTKIVGCQKATNTPFHFYFCIFRQAAATMLLFYLPHILCSHIKQYSQIQQSRKSRSIEPDWMRFRGEHARPAPAPHWTWQSHPISHPRYDIRQLTLKLSSTIHCITAHLPRWQTQTTRQ